MMHLIGLSPTSPAVADRARHHASAIKGRKSVGGNNCNRARKRGFDGHQYLRHQRSKIGEPTRLCVKHNDGDRENGDVLLEGEISIERSEHIKLLLGKRQQYS
ncbi:hypothetical protein [Bradyrhizobium sp.]|uniref:hypothetical protein n=1 Tax=Bradyrhizobium sp. TaxID=376 RepID=UPI00238DEB92|nr:hypothetical protein [Bradyrhizobium sp.]MDE2378873.1 hypothetical protein [Bradyrhizobium sp.]